MNVAKNCAKCDRPDTADNLVGCDKCETWMHFGCAQVTDSIAEDNRSWKCDRCHEEESILQSRASIGRSTSSRRSSRIDLNLRMMEEQKAMRMRRLLAEDAAQAAIRAQLAEEEENFLKKKYELLLAEAEDSEDGVSRKSRLSSRASQEKVRSWLSEQEVGTAQVVTVVPSSSSLPTTVSTETVQQSTIPAPIVSSPIASNVPTIVATGPASTSTPLSVDGSKGVACSVAMTVPQVPTAARLKGNFVSHTEITFGVPRKPPVSSSLLPRSSSSIGINTLVAMDAISAPQKIHSSAPPSIVDFPPMSSRNPLPVGMSFLKH